MPDDFYSSHAWQKLRAQVKARWKRLGLSCAMCRMPLDWGSKGMVHVDHVKGRKAHPHLAMSPNNLVCLHSGCHNSAKQAHEQGNNKQIGLDGWPVNTNGSR